MRILHICRTYHPDSKGGIQEAIRQICLTTQTYKVESRVFCLSPNPTPKSVSLSEGEIIRSRSWIAPASCDIGGPESFLSFQKLLSWADIIHYHFPWPFLDLLHFFNFSKKPCVLTYHSDIVKQKILKKLYAPLMHRTLNTMSAVIATSPNYLESSPVLRQYLSKGNVKVIPLGISRPHPSVFQSNISDIEYLNRFGIKGGKYILFIGVLRYYKGLHSLISAAQSIEGNIVIAGDGMQANHLKELVKLHQLKNVIFLGEVTEQEKHLLLRNCVAVILPSHLRSEAFGLVLIEAAMHAKAMICCEVGSGTSFVNLHGVTGLVIPPENPAAISEACNKLLNNIPLASQMGQAALKRYEALFSENALGKAHMALYSSLLGIHSNSS